MKPTIANLPRCSASRPQRCLVTSTDDINNEQKPGIQFLNLNYRHPFQTACQNQLQQSLRQKLRKK